MLTDAESKYMCNAYPYLGKAEDRAPEVNAAQHVVLQLAGPYLKKGRNVTTDNYFTTLSLARELKAQDTSLVIGTVNRKRREVPPEVKSAKGAKYSTVFLKNEDTSMTVYQGKVDKNVIVLSTMQCIVLHCLIVIKNFLNQ